MARTHSDKLYERARLTFARKSIGTKSPRDRVLIVCEGEVTEPRYFSAFCSTLRLSKENVRICGEECGSTPSSVYKYAIAELEGDFRDISSDDYDRVYCVFDKDTHACYQRTLNAIKKKSIHSIQVKQGKVRISKEAKIIAVQSVPCFEFWALLHFTYTTSHFRNSAEIGKVLKKYIQGYKKDETKDLYPCLKDKTAIATKNAINALKAAKSNTTDNPTTYILRCTPSSRPATGVI